MLKIRNLTVSVADKIVLHDINLSVEAGCLHALMGPNGSGKSTLAYTLMGHPRYKINAGTIEFNGINLLELPVEKRARAGLFLASQYAPEIPGVQVFTFLKEAYRMLVGTEITVSDFKNLVLPLFDLVKLDHAFLYRNLYEQFSGGEKKRLEIVQLLLFKPRLAILDEIDSGLDVDGLKLIAHAIAQLQQENKQMSIILITHYQRILNYVMPDHVQVLQSGIITHTGNSLLAQQIEQQGYHEL
jgi:Fe-S cluster assembly ATP-binding protein